MSDYISNFISGPNQILALVSVLALWTGFVVIGAAIFGRNRIQEVDHLVGWGIISFLITLPSVFSSLNFNVLAITSFALALGAAVYVYWRDHRLLAGELYRILLLGSN